MAYKQKGGSPFHRNFGIGSPAKASPVKRVGSFVDGVRVTFADALIAEEEGKAVTFSNKDAIRKNELDLKSDDKDTRLDAEGLKRNWENVPVILTKEEQRAKNADEKAQRLLEKRTKILSGEIKTGDRDIEGRQGGAEKRLSEKEFEERNQFLQTQETSEGMDPDNVHSGVVGATETISTEAAQKGSSGSKSYADYLAEQQDREDAADKLAFIEKYGGAE